MITDEQKTFLSVLEQSLGIQSVALQKTGVSIETLNKWKKNMFFLEKLNQVEQTAGDYVENQLLKQIREGNTQAITFYLKTKLKTRGYT